MGWLPVRRKHKSNVDPEQEVVRAVEGVGDTSGAGVMGTGNAGVGAAVGGTSVNVTHYNQRGKPVYTPPTAVPPVLIGARYPNALGKGRDDALGVCGDARPYTVMVGGCVKGHVQSWYCCSKCQIETLAHIKEDANNCYLMPCGDLYMDLIYSYLPEFNEYDRTVGRVFNVNGREVD